MALAVLGVGELLQKTSLIAAGLSQTVETPDALPLGPWAGLGVVSADAAVALLGAGWLIAKRDA
jgi:ABC-2 type transport system permease protein